MTRVKIRVFSTHDTVQNDVSACLKHSFLQRLVHPSFGRVKTNSSKTIDIVSYAFLKVSINGVTCVFVVLFRSKK